MKRIALFCVFLGLSGCGVLKHSQPARVFVLDATAASTAAPSEAAPTGAVGVLKVTVPAWVDRPEIAVRATGGEVVANPYALWGEPISRGIQRVVVENLAALLPDRRVVTAPFGPKAVPEHRVDITVTELARQADGSVLVEARYAILARDGAALRQRRTSHRATAPVGPAGMVAGVSEGLSRLSQDVAEALRALPPPQAAPIP